MELTGYGLTVESIERVVKGEKVTIAPEAYHRLKASRKVVLQVLDSQQQIYGLNTGVVKIRIEKSRKIKLRNLIVS